MSDHRMRTKGKARAVQRASVAVVAPPIQIPPLAALPPEMFDEVLSHLRVLPLSFYHGTCYDSTYGDLPHPQFRERIDTLRALAGTCKALREVSYPRLWSRLDICWVPLESKGTWYKYIMQALQLKAQGVINANDHLRSNVRAISFILQKSDIDATLASLKSLLSVLPNLTTIQVINCRIPGDFGKAMRGLSFPNVRTVIIPTDCHAILKSCPNATHVRCAGGTGVTLIGSLKACNCETLDGMIDWVKDMKAIDRLVKNAQNLRKIEIRRPVVFGLGILSQNKAPAEWSQVIPKLAGLPKLRVIVLSFPGIEELPSDRVSIEKAREVLQKSRLQEEKKLIVRRVIAQHYASPLDNKDGQVGDLIHSSTEETFP